MQAQVESLNTLSPSQDASSVAAAVCHDAPSASLPVNNSVSGLKLEDLAQIIESYNSVTEKLQRSHDVLSHEVLRLQEELAGKDAQLQRSKRLAALGEMAAGIAHEIRNPLAAIHLYAQMLTSDLVGFDGDGVSGSFTEQVDTSKKIAHAVRGLNAVVNDVLSFSRELKPRLAQVSVSALFDRAIETHWPVIEAAGVEVVRCDLGHESDVSAPAARKLSGADSPAVLVDIELLNQALLNLIRNAVDAMVSDESVASEENGGEILNRCDGELALDKFGRGQLVLDVRDDNHQVVMTIRDTGKGIETEAVDRIFNPFFTTRSTGTGLGLAIVHRIIDAHGGAISVFNDGGAVFELRLPRVA
jgi:signal transduction histidine kinase